MNDDGTSNVRLVAIALGSLVVAALGYIAIQRRSSVSRLPNYIDGGDVQAELTKATVESRGAWEVFSRLAKLHGSIYSFKLRGTPVVVLNDAKLVWELLEKRGESYSSRPRLVTAQEILSRNLRGMSSQYNEHWKKWKKVMHVGLNARQSLEYRAHQTLEATIFLRDLYHNVKQHRELTQRFAASVVLSISYGRRVTRVDDHIVTYQQKSGIFFLKSTVPGKHVADSVQCFDVPLNATQS